MLHTDPTGLCVPESDGPLACDPSLRSSLQNYLRDSRPFDNRARGDQGYQGINVVFDRYPAAAYAYEVSRDTELRAFVTSQLPWVDADATLAQLDFNLQQWKLNYAQRHDLDADIGAATVGMLGLGAVYGLECFFGPDKGGGAGGGTGRYAFQVLDEADGIRVVAGSGPKGEIRFISEEVIENDTLYMRGFHIEGPGAASLGRAELNAFGQEYGLLRGVSTVVIQGGKRTTGRYKGQYPRPFVIKVK